jgi:hypothetical protein
MQRIIRKQKARIIKTNLEIMKQEHNIYNEEKTTEKTNIIKK